MFLCGKYYLWEAPKAAADQKHAAEMMAKVSRPHPHNSTRPVSNSGRGGGRRWLHQSSAAKAKAAKANAARGLEGKPPAAGKGGEEVISDGVKRLRGELPQKRAVVAGSTEEWAKME